MAPESPLMFKICEAGFLCNILQYWSFSSILGYITLDNVKQQFIRTNLQYQLSKLNKSRRSKLKRKLYVKEDILDKNKRQTKKFIKQILFKSDICESQHILNLLLRVKPEYFQKFQNFAKKFLQRDIHKVIVLNFEMGDV